LQEKEGGLFSFRGRLNLTNDPGGNIRGEGAQGTSGELVTWIAKKAGRDRTRT